MWGSSLKKPGRKRRIPFGMTSFQPTAVSFCGFVGKKYKISHTGMGRKNRFQCLFHYYKNVSPIIRKYWTSNRLRPPSITISPKHHELLSYSVDGPIHVLAFYCPWHLVKLQPPSSNQQLATFSRSFSQQKQPLLPIHPDALASLLLTGLPTLGRGSVRVELPVIVISNKRFTATKGEGSTWVGWFAGDFFGDSGWSFIILSISAGSKIPLILEVSAKSG